MSVETVKDAAFRHCEKIILVVVVLFVAWKVHSYLAPREEPDVSIRGGGPPGAAPAGEPVEYVADTIKPFEEVPEPSKADHDPFWPQRVEMLDRVVLIMKEGETVTAMRKLSSPLVGGLHLAPLSDRERYELYRGRAGGLAPGRGVPYDPRRPVPPGPMPPEAMGPGGVPAGGVAPGGVPGEATRLEPCQVRYTISEDRLTLTFEAVKDGGWIALEGTLENKNKVRVLCRVWKVAPPPPVVLLRPTEITAEEEELGYVVVRWILQQVPTAAAEPRAAAGQRTQYFSATYYDIYRKVEPDGEKRLIGRVQGSGAGAVRRPVLPSEVPPEEMMPVEPGVPYDPSMMPPPARERQPTEMGPPPGLPGVPGGEALLEGRGAGMPPEGLEPVPAARGREFQPTRAERQGEFAYTDSSVESETAYTYWVEAVLTDRDGVEIARAGCCVKDESSKCGGHTITTAEKFSFAFISITGKGAQIVVFIGLRERPLDYRIFEVPIGGRIGDIPGQAPKTPTPVPAGAAAPAPAAERKEGYSYITRFVLVDIQSQALQLVEGTTVVPRVGPDGRPRPESVKTYQYVPKHVAILRDRKNRLVELPHESRSLLEALGRKGRPEERRRPPREGIPEWMPEEMMPPPRPRTKGGRSPYPRRGERLLEGR